MKHLLNFFPRSWLINLSIWFRPIIKWYFKGTCYIDPIDGSSYRKFLPYGYVNLRSNALCPGTLSLERHRLLWLYLERETPFFKQPLKVLHLAPEHAFYKKFITFLHWDYTTADLYSPIASIKADICKLPFKENSYDLVLCNHVLEHVQDDKKAISELYRVLKKGGTLIAQVPLDINRKRTLEDNSITNRKERTKIFGQYDHVRIYGKDFFEFLNQAGFNSKAILYSKNLSNEEIKKYNILEEIIPVAKKK